MCNSNVQTDSIKVLAAMNSNIIFKSIPVLLLLVIILFTASVRAKLSADIWFVEAGKA